MAYNLWKPLLSLDQSSASGPQALYHLPDPNQIVTQRRYSTTCPSANKLQPTNVDYSPNPKSLREFFARPDDERRAHGSPYNHEQAGYNSPENFTSSREHAYSSSQNLSPRRHSGIYETSRDRAQIDMRSQYESTGVDRYGNRVQSSTSPHGLLPPISRDMIPTRESQMRPGGHGGSSHRAPSSDRYSSSPQDFSPSGSGRSSERIPYHESDLADPNGVFR